MKHQTFVTIGLCVRNCEKTVSDAIKSIIQQDYPHNLIELIIVDDGSTDRTLEYVKRIVSETDIRVKIYRQKWKGLGTARNVVVRNSLGKYIIWVDGDMRLPRDHVRKQVEFMNDNPKVGAAKARYAFFDAGKIVALLENSRAFHIRPNNSLILGTGGSIYRVETIRQVGGFDERIRGAGEDIDVLFRMIRKGWLIGRTNAYFYEKFKESWKDLWAQYFWWGYGAHYVWHRYKSGISIVLRLPLISFIVGFLRLYHIFKVQKKLALFLIPVHNMFKDSAWIFGFFKSHVDGYGHKT